MLRWICAVGRFLEKRFVTVDVQHVRENTGELTGQLPAIELFHIPGRGGGEFSFAPQGVQSFEMRGHGIAIVRFSEKRDARMLQRVAGFPCGHGGEYGFSGREVFVEFPRGCDIHSA